MGDKHDDPSSFFQDVGRDHDPMSSVRPLCDWGRE